MAKKCGNRLFSGMTIMVIAGVLAAIFLPQTIHMKDRITSDAIAQEAITMPASDFKVGDLALTTDSLVVVITRIGRVSGIHYCHLRSGDMVVQPWTDQADLQQVFLAVYHDGTPAWEKAACRLVRQ